MSQPNGPIQAALLLLQPHGFGFLGVRPRFDKPHPAIQTTPNRGRTPGGRVIPFCQLSSLYDQADFRTGSDQDQLRASAAHIGQHIGSSAKPFCGCKDRPVESGHVLAGQAQSGRSGGGAPGQFARLWTTSFASHGRITYRSGMRPQCGQMLHRLVSGPIFTQADAVVGVDPDAAGVGNGRQAHGRAHVVREDQEGGPKRNRPPWQGHAVDRCTHGMLAHPKVQVAAHIGIRLEIGAAV